MHYKEDYYRELINLYMKNELLEKKHEKIINLIKECDNQDEKDLILHLLSKIVFITQDKYNILLNNIVNYIIDLDLDYSKMQLVATAMDEEADSSQTILQALKMKLTEKGKSGFITVNSFNKAVQKYHNDFYNIIVVDEFFGTGSTIRNRFKTFKERITLTKPFNFHFVFVAGMNYTLKNINKSDYSIFCSLPLDRGLTDEFNGAELEKKYELMLNMELKLAQTINNKNIYDYSFGYGGSEALYSSELCLGNTPNSVFPIFWWKKDFKNRDRNSILTRYETGF